MAPLPLTPLIYHEIATKKMKNVLETETVKLKLILESRKSTVTVYQKKKLMIQNIHIDSHE